VGHVALERRAAGPQDDAAVRPRPLAHGEQQPRPADPGRPGDDGAHALPAAGTRERRRQRGELGIALEQGAAHRTRRYARAARAVNGRGAARPAAPLRRRGP